MEFIGLDLAWSKGSDKRAANESGIVLLNSMGKVVPGISDLPAPDGPFIHLKAAQRTKRLFVTASSRFRGRQLSAGGRASH